MSSRPNVDQLSRAVVLKPRRRGRAGHTLKEVPGSQPLKPRKKYGSVFAGVGGFDCGFKRAGVTCGWQVENDRQCIEILERHFPGVPRFGDVEEWEPDPKEHAVDVICAGFPCQDLSVAGKRAGLRGERSSLFWHVVRIASILHPEWLVLENVPGLLSSNEGRDFGIVLGALEDAGYSVAWRVLDSQWFGVAQRRRRVFLVCHPDAERAAAVLFEPEGCEGHPQAMRKTGEDIAHAVNTRSGGASAKENNETLVADPITASFAKHGGCSAGKDSYPRNLVSHALVSRHSPSFDPNEETPVPYTVFGNRPCESRTAREARVAEPLSCEQRTTSNSDQNYVVAFGENQRSEVVIKDKPTLNTGGGKPGRGYPAVACQATDTDRMREATGVPGWLDVAIPKGTDGRRYRQLGNAVTVNVAEWIGRRIVEVS
ncbi:MAG: DNA cytosine methyltransferase [Phycisphaerales bacterium]|nr:DNA cytosine methyltransferase [Phycisphaerales bacterium]